MKTEYVFTERFTAVTIRRFRPSGDIDIEFNLETSEPVAWLRGKLRDMCKLVERLNREAGWSANKLDVTHVGGDLFQVILTLEDGSATQYRTTFPRL